MGSKKLRIDNWVKTKRGVLRREGGWGKGELKKHGRVKLRKTGGRDVRRGSGRRSPLNIYAVWVSLDSCGSVGCPRD